MLYKLTRDWGGFAKGAVIEVVSPERLAAMNGDEVNKPAGVPYIPEPEPITKQKVNPEPKSESKSASSKQGRQKKEK